ncbi:putative mitochondrial membrane protein FMP10 [Rhypophila sp. PSN 637]
MTSRIQYQQLLRLSQRQISRQQNGLHIPAERIQQPARIRQPLIAAQCRQQAARFSTTRPRPQDATAEPSEPVAPKPKKKSAVRRFLFAGTFLLLGAITGASLKLLVEPPEPPTPNSPEDEYTIEVLHDQAAKLPIVKQLTSDPAFVESWDAYETLSPKHKSQHLMAGVMTGSRGVGGYQRIWYNQSTGELVSVVFLGGATTGWPGVVHGGLLATILDESCGRAAFKQWAGKTGVTARLELNYKKATLANGFYVIRARPREEEQLPEGERGKRHYKIFVDAIVEDANTGAVQVVSEAIFVGGSGKDQKKEKGRVWGKAMDEHTRF